ncbi:lysophospholipid acyltransferase family protein [bacterium]|nr:lysophospholipid acyltransferase family protein [bacterium]
MTTNEKLYSDVAPTKIRNRKEKFRKAKNVPFFVWLADRVFFRMLSHRFYALRVKNLELYEKINKNYPTMFYAPHMNWWDGIVGYNLMRRTFKIKRIRMMVEEMNRFPLFSYAGAFPVNKASAQEAMKSLKYIVEDLKSPDMAMWIFPQGIVKPPNYRPIEFQTGLTYVGQNVAKKHGGINIVPVAVNYTFLREDRPECLAVLGEPIILTKDNCNFDRREFTKKIEEEFTQLCDEQLKSFSVGDVTGYEYVFRQDLPWNRKLEKKLKRIAIDEDVPV